MPGLEYGYRFAPKGGGECLSLHFLPNSSPIPLHYFPNLMNWADKGGSTGWI